jgi:hypothetical protein
MTGFIAHLYNLLLHFTNHSVTHYVFSSPSSSTAISRDSLSSCYIDLGRPQQKTLFPNNSSVVIEVCLPHRCVEMVVLPLVHGIHFGGNLFTKSLPSNERQLLLCSSGFQASCHIAPSLRLFIPNGLQVYCHFFSEACDWSHLPSCGLAFLLCLLSNRSYRAVPS